MHCDSHRMHTVFCSGSIALSEALARQGWDVHFQGWGCLDSHLSCVDFPLLLHIIIWSSSRRLLPWQIQDYFLHIHRVRHRPSSAVPWRCTRYRARNSRTATSVSTKPLKEFFGFIDLSSHNGTLDLYHVWDLSSLRLAPEGSSRASWLSVQSSSPFHNNNGRSPHFLEYFMPASIWAPWYLRSWPHGSGSCNVSARSAMFSPLVSRPCWWS